MLLGYYLEALCLPPYPLSFSSVPVPECVTDVLYVFVDIKVGLEHFVCSILGEGYFYEALHPGRLQYYCIG